MRRLRVNPQNGAVLAGGAPRRQVSWRIAVTALTAVLALAIASGYLASSSSTGFLIAVFLAGLMAYFVIRWTRAGFVALLVFTSTLFSPEFFFFIDTNTVYYAYEMLLILVVGGSLLAAAREDQKVGPFERLSASPAAMALLVFFAVVTIKALVIVVENRFAPGSISQMYTFNRGLSFFLLFIPALLLFGNVKRQRWIIAVTFVLGGIVVTRVLLELLFPDSNLLFGVSQPLSTEVPSVDETVQRLRAPGGTFMLVCFWVGLMNIVLREWKPRRMAFYVPFTLVMLVGVLLEFNRSYVIPMMGLFVLALFLNKKNVRLKLLAMGGAGLLSLVLAFSVSGTLDKYMDAVVVRYGSAFTSESLESRSIKSREIEQHYAWQRIREAPLFGIGLDELYRPPVLGMYDNLRWYIHNSYIWLFTYFGILGLTAFLAAFGLVLLRIVLRWRRIMDPFLQAALVGFMFSLATLMAANFAAPKFYDMAAVPVVALMLGLAEAIIITGTGKSGRAQTGA